MRNLNLHVTVPADRKVVVQLLDGIDPGEADLTVIVRKSRPTRPEPSILDRLPSLSVGAWPDSLSFSRNELYGDDDR